MADKKRASGKVVVDGDKGTVVPKGTLFLRDDGPPFETTQEVVVGEDEQVSVDVVATVDGQEGGAAPGTAVRLDPRKTISGLSDEGLVGADGVELGAPKPAKKADKAADKASAEAAEPAAAECHVHLFLNGAGDVRLKATYRGSKKGLHSASYPRLVDGAVEMVAVDDAPLYDPKAPVYPSIEK